MKMREPQVSNAEALRRLLVHEWEGYRLRPSDQPAVPGERSVTIEQVKARLDELFANPGMAPIELRPGATREELELVMPEDAMSRLQIWLSNAAKHPER